MQALHEAIAACCGLAKDYYAKNMSPLALLDASGYRRWHWLVSVGKIREHLAQHPELIWNWVMYSKNKRVSSGWYFEAESTEGPFVVGYFPGERQERYYDAAEACAQFVKRELDSIAK